MALADVATLAADAGFNAKIKAQVARSAVATGLDLTVNDEQTALARDILTNIDAYASRVAFAVAADKSGDATAVDTDVEIQAAVNRVLRAFGRR